MTTLQKLHELAEEAKADEQKIVGKHRRNESPRTKTLRAAHNASKHAVHFVWLTWVGMPAILTFEAGRPFWEKYVELPLSTVMVGTSHTEAFSALAHFLTLG